MTNKLADLRVLDSVDDLIDDLTANMRHTLADLDRQLERIQQVRSTVERSLASLTGKPEKPSTPKVATLTIAPTKALGEPKKPAAFTTPSFVCEHCGDSLPSARGLAIHRGLKHKPTPVEDGAVA